ncbi:uncharacterized protein LOC109826745 [Asparagus officinalis]|uniref:uncharacterized protein LOC109826745 n=1 Tax=Asparagus officinalis TaxID=4686 RepID=UPI00098E4A10|nr:uncharacterized protein LOC109826745 [Asparagus officinalis]
MSRSLFLRIVDAVNDHDYYFQQRSDGLGRMGLSLLQKVTVVFHMLAYGLPTDATDEYVKIGMLGSLDCMHWKWKNCPTAWSGQYAERGGSPTIILEAVADYDLWIWHAYFGMPGTNNNINVLESSNLFSNLAQGIAPPAHYVIQGKEQFKDKDAHIALRNALIDHLWEEYTISDS